MLKRVLKRSASLFLAAIMLISLFPAVTLTVAAADISAPDGFEVQSQSGTVQFESGKITVIATNTPASSSGCGGGTPAKSETSQLVLKSTRDKEAQVSFHYTATKSTLSGAYAKIAVNDTEYMTNGDVTVTLPAGGILTISAYSGSASDTGNAQSKVVVTNLSLAVNEDITTTFLPAENGSFTVDGEAKTALTKNAMETTALKATPDAGYKFFGWYSVTEGTYLSKDADWTTNLTKEQVIKAVFAPANAPTFQAGTGNEYFDLNEAVAFAQANNQKAIVLVGDGTLPAGEYAIPSGITLLIPYNDAHTICTTEPIWHKNDSSASSAKAYKTLTMASGANITVQSGGAISVSARAQNTTPNAGLVMGPWGLIKMEDGSNITVENNANLYCYGFITGKGNVLAQSGAKVYEDFQVPSFRGGNASASMNGGAKNNVFPFTQFYVQNIEVPLTLEAGATETVCIGVTMSVVGLQRGSGVLIGNSSGLFRLTNGTVTKRYDGATDRLVIEIDGDAQISQMTVNMGSAGNIDSTKFVVPITNNMTVHVNSDHDLDIEYDMAMLPGSVMSVDQGANLTLNSGKNFYIYDRDEWIGKGYASNNAAANFVKLSNVPGRTYNRTDADLADARLDINGTMIVNGALYTTAGGADITTSDGTGKLIYNSPAGTAAETYQVTQSSNQVTVASVAITPAKLKNTSEEAEEYSVTTDVAADDAFYYHDGMWDKENAPAGEHYPHSVVIDEAVASTCCETGLTEGSHCSVCGKILVAQTVVEKSDHTWNDGEVTKAATCLEQGEKTFTCTVEGCGETKIEKTPFGDHAWDQGVQTKAPTCSDVGIMTYTCMVCDAARTEEINTVEHMPETDARVEPTCVNEGKTEGSHCSVCGAVITAQETIPALTHDYGPVIWQRTKTEDGYTATATITCKREGCTAETEGHILTAVATAEKTTEKATCTEDGKDSYTVTVQLNGKEETNTWIETIPASGHKPVEIPAHAPTCTEPGLEAGVKCEVCGEIITEQKEIPAEGHTWDTWSETKAATCTEKGEETHTCIVCGETGSRETAALGHDTEQHSAKAATCTDIGWNAYETCKRCDYTTYQEIKALDHDFTELKHDADGHWMKCSRCDAAQEKQDHVWDAGTVTMAATCTTEGTKTFACTVCGETRTESIDALGHSYDEGVVTSAATCESEGVKTFTCQHKGCGNTYTETIAVTGHAWDDGIQTKAPTCTVEGEMTFTCETCRKTRIERIDIEPGNHVKFDYVEKVDATCTEDGHMEYWLCADCGAVFSDANGVNPIELENTVIKAGHKWMDWEITTFATCQTPGEETRTCAGCDAVETRPIDQLKHDLVYVAEKAATCENTGNIAHYLCNGCGHFFEDAEAVQELNSVVTEVLPHEWGAWTVFIEPGCETEGEEIRTCGLCGAAETRPIDALDHCYGEPVWTWTGDEENVDWIAASAEFVCGRCGDSQTVEAQVKHETHNATCTGEGAEVYTATVKFGKTEDGEDRIYTDVMDVTISALGHVYDKAQESVDWNWTKAENGAWTVTAALRCTECDEELVLSGEDVTITDAVTTEPTCEDVGERIYTAKVTVGDVEYTSQEAEIVDALGHSIVSHEGKAPTCTESGYDAYETCSRCDYTTRGEDIEARGHSWNEGEVTVEPTCTAEGVMTHTCTACGEVKTEAVAKIDHQTVFIEGKVPTCTEDGNSAYYICTACDGLFSDEAGQLPTTLAEKRIPATGHHYDPETVAFTWVQNDQGGWIATATIACTCGDELPAVNARITFEDTAPTCEKEGTRTFAASAELDGNAYTDTMGVTLPKLGHSYGNPVWIWNETDTGAAVTFTCANDPTEVETVEATVTSSTQGYTTTYTAVVEFDGQTYRDVKTVTVTPPTPPTGGGGSIGGAVGGDTDIADADVPLADIFPFEDVSDDFWGRDDIATVYQKGLMMGVDDGTIFAPHMSTTRGMIVTILYRVAEGNVTAEEAFSDVNTASWYGDAVTWGTKNNVIAGYGNGLFGPDDEITREQLVSILWRYMGKPAAKDAALPFSDANQVSDYAREAMQWALEQGIISGKSEAILDPRGHATRAETAAILNRYLKLTEAEK